MKKSILALIALAALSLPCAFAHEGDEATERSFDKSSDKSKDNSWEAPCIAGKTSSERWETIAKNASSLIGLTKDDVEKKLGKSKYNDKHMTMMYSITENATSKGMWDSLTLSLDKDGKVYKFVTVTAYKD